MNIVTWNVNSLRVRLESVQEWVRQNQPDLLCLQELKMPDDEFPHDAFADLGYHCAVTGQKTYNGVAIISKQPLQNVVCDLPGLDDPQRRFIAGDYPAPGGDSPLRIINVYVPNGQSPDSDKFDYKRGWLKHLRQTIREYLRSADNLVLVGDFNITPSWLDVHDPTKWQGKIHCTDTERLILQTLLSEGVYDTYRLFEPGGDRFSWWDYRGDNYSRNEGLRIDLILSSSAMLDRAQDCRIDETPRQQERPSDHTPVVATYQF